MDQVLAGKSAIVTGASRGIGRGIALGMAQAGADLVLSARTMPDLEAVAEQIRAMGRRAICVHMDAYKYEDLAAVVERTVAEFGKLDILVNNAGGSRNVDKGWLGFLDTPPESLEGVFRLNLFSPVVMSQYAARVMVRQRSGAIINITSPMAVYTSSKVQTYSAAKAALNEMTKLWAVELGRYNVRVNAILPGPIETATTDKFMTPAVMKNIQETVPLGRIGYPDDVAPLAVFLASDGARFINGATVLVTGGRRGEAAMPPPPESLSQAD